jgi:Recombination endonuclease VII
MPFKDKIKAKEYAQAYRARRTEINKVYQKEYQNKNKNLLTAYKANWYKSKRFDKYGITQELFDKALQNQQFNCAICRQAFSDSIRVFVDHCHKTGKVRGLVCFHCNTGLGHFKDDTELLKKAIEYLNDNPFSYT